MTEIWYQVEFHSNVEDRWIPLFGRHGTIESAREASALIGFNIRSLEKHSPKKNERVRIAHITRTVEVVE